MLLSEGNQISPDKIAHKQNVLNFIRSLSVEIKFNNQIIYRTIYFISVNEIDTAFGSLESVALFSSFLNTTIKC